MADGEKIGISEHDVNLIHFTKERKSYPMRVTSDDDDSCISYDSEHCKSFGRSKNFDLPQHVRDSQVPAEYVRGSHRAYCKKTLPPGLVIKKSDILGAGLGVFATVDFPSGTIFGPYKGKIQHSKTLGKAADYSWQIIKNKKHSHFVDGSDPSNSNWMRYVNCSRSEKEQCVTAIQHRWEIYFRAHRHICTGTEILVYYGCSFARYLGIKSHKVRSLSRIRSDTRKTLITSGVNSSEQCDYPPLNSYGSAIINYSTICSSYDSGISCSSSINGDDNNADGNEDSSNSKCDSNISNHGNGDHRCISNNIFGDDTCCSMKRKGCRDSCINSGISNRHDRFSSNSLISDLTRNVGRKKPDIEYTESGSSIQHGIKDRLKLVPCQTIGHSESSTASISKKTLLTPEIRTAVEEKRTQDTSVLKKEKQSGQAPGDDSDPGSRLSSTLEVPGHNGHGRQTCCYTEGGRKVSRKWNLQPDIGMHSGVRKKFQCSICDLKLTSINSLRNHENTCLKRQSKKCSNINIQLSGIITRGKHKIPHEKIRNFECDKCDAKFSKKCDLTRHNKIHTGEKPFRCHICYKQFRQKSNRDVHIRIHTGEKPYKCIFCGKAFTQLHHFNRHKQVHRRGKVFLFK